MIKKFSEINENVADNIISKFNTSNEVWVRGIIIDSEINNGTAALVQIPCLDDPKRMKEMIVKKTNIK